MSFCSFDFEWNFFLNNLYKYVLYLIDLLLLFMMNDIVLGFLFVGVGLYLVGCSGNVLYFCCFFVLV